MSDQITTMLREGLNQIRDDVGDLRKDVKESHRIIHKKIDDGFAHVNGRVRRLEAWRNWIMGAVGFGGAVFGILYKIGLFQ